MPRAPILVASSQQPSSNSHCTRLGAARKVFSSVRLSEGHRSRRGPLLLIPQQVLLFQSNMVMG